MFLSHPCNGKHLEFYYSPLSHFFAAIVVPNRRWLVLVDTILCRSKESCHLSFPSSSGLLSASPRVSATSSNSFAILSCISSPFSPNPLRSFETISRCRLLRPYEGPRPSHSILERLPHSSAGHCRLKYKHAQSKPLAHRGATFVRMACSRRWSCT